MAYDIGSKETAEEKAARLKKYEAAVSKSTKWKPIFSRIIIKKDPEPRSGLLDLETIKLKEHLVRGTIFLVGTEAGFKDGREVVKFYPGQKVLYLASNMLEYKSPDGTEWLFLKQNADVESIYAIEDEE
jgi:hypothetical protein